LLRAKGFLAPGETSTAGGKHLLIEARLIEVPAEAKEKMEAGLAKVSPGATSGPALLTEDQAKAFVAHADALKSVKTLAAPKVIVVENQEARMFVGENRPLSLPLVGEAPPAGNTGIRTTILFSSGVRLVVTAALAPDGQSVSLKAEPCVSKLEEKGGKTLLTEARGEVQCAVPLGQWLLLRAPQKSYRLTAISQKDDPASGTISMEVLREPLPKAGKTPDGIWILLRPSLAQPADKADSARQFEESIRQLDQPARENASQRQWDPSADTRGAEPQG